MSQNLDRLGFIEYQLLLLFFFFIIKIGISEVQCTLTTIV